MKNLCGLTTTLTPPPYSQNAFVNNNFWDSSLLKRFAQNRRVMSQKFISPRHDEKFVWLNNHTNAPTRNRTWMPVRARFSRPVQYHYTMEALHLIVFMKPKGLLYTMEAYFNHRMENEEYHSLEFPNSRFTMEALYL